MAKTVGIDLGTTNSVVSVLEVALQELKGALGGSDVAAIRDATERLTTASHAFTTRLYEQAIQQAPDGGATAPDDDVVDAEIVDEESSSS